ncbi:unnamed protein product [Didymodactylos carnosus]|uniref:G domain-containing protein n=1 Tax=Didymodactylos carnosus TaxID=1234261 RepID=A0A8S2DEQ4_9BILA|nr:unnamed protein product [Didymodactylos carnosus]CAF3723316.1 unnamed protein product [Didymodactylos carnosus]
MDVDNCTTVHTRGSTQSLIADNRQSRFTITEGENDKAHAGYYFDETKTINMLFIGRTQTPKSSIIEALNNPRFCKTSSGFSETRDPKCYALSLFDNLHKNIYQVNIIDTPGLQEKPRYPLEDRTDRQLLSLAKKCIESNLTKLNCVCFVSQAGCTNLYDIDVFDVLMKFLGLGYSENSMMILTHSDGFTFDKLAEFHAKFRTHPKSVFAYNYCKLGIYNHGIINYDELATYVRRPNLQQEMMEEKSDHLIPMRQKLIECFITTADKQIEVSALEAVIKENEKIKADMMEKLWKEKKIKFVQ